MILFHCINFNKTINTRNLYLGYSVISLNSPSTYVWLRYNLTKRYNLNKQIIYTYFFLVIVSIKNAFDLIYFSYNGIYSSN